MSKVTITIKDSDGNLVNTRYEEYDSHNNLISLNFVNPEGVTIESKKYSFEYNSDNKIIKETSYDTDGSIKRIWEYSYTE